MRRLLPATVRELQTEVSTGSLPLAADVAARAATVAGARGAPAAGRARGPGDPLVADRGGGLGDRAGRRAGPEHLDRGRRSEVGDGQRGRRGRAGRERRAGRGRQGRAVGAGASKIGIDALDAAAIRPFWQAVLGYVDEPGRSGPWDGLVDPLGQGRAVWFQRMDAPRPQRNRVHFDVSVPHDEAAPRIRAVLAAAAGP